MPNELIITGAIAFGLSGLILFLRVPAFAVLFSLFVGQIMSTQASSDVYGFIMGLSRMISYDVVEVGLVLLPMLLTIFFLKARVSRSRVFIEFMPALFCGITLLLILYPLIPAVQTLLDIATNDQIAGFRSFSLIAAAAIGLVSVWLSVPKGHGLEKHHHEK